MFLENFFNLQSELDDLLGRSFFRDSTFSRGISPAINLFEKGDGLVLKAEVPGMEKKDLVIEVYGDALSLSGEKKDASKGEGCCHRKERAVGSFKRQIKLPYRVNTEKVEAKLQDGVLTLNMSKEESEKPRSIIIK